MRCEMRCGGEWQVQEMYNNNIIIVIIISIPLFPVNRWKTPHPPTHAHASHPISSKGAEYSIGNCIFIHQHQHRRTFCGAKVPQRSEVKEKSLKIRTASTLLAGVGDLRGDCESAQLLLCEKTLCRALVANEGEKKRRREKKVLRIIEEICKIQIIREN